MKFADIPSFTRSPCYMVNVELKALPSQYARFVHTYGLHVDPDFQRGHVWTPEQKTRFMEFFLRGGATGRDIYINAKGWNRSDLGPVVLVDGKQRLDAALGFLNNEVSVFGGHHFRDFTDNPRLCNARFNWHVNDLESREEVLAWYIEMNSGGTVHSEEEISRVRALKDAGGPFPNVSEEEIRVSARLDRALVKEEIDRILEEEARHAKAREEALTAPPKKLLKPRKKV